MPQNSNEVVAGRDVIAYVEPWAAANAFPTISAWGTSPGGSWVDQGYTKDGAHIQWRMQYQEYTVDQQLDPVARIPSQRDLRMRANLGQIDAAVMVNATGQGTSASTSASTGVRGHNDFTLTGTIAASYYSIYYDVRSPVSGEAARVGHDQSTVSTTHPGDARYLHGALQRGHCPAQGHSFDRRYVG
jgi:hypothetical protein